MWNYVYTDELYHWGIKGQKWGVRRYRNEDGTLTDAGKKRYDRDTKDLSDAKKKKYQADPDKWVQEDISNARTVANESGNLANRLKTINDSGRKSKVIKMDLSNMTDQQMRNEINRELLERQYNDMFAPRKVSRGREIMSSVLNSSAAVLGVASSALGIALAIKQLKG